MQNQLARWVNNISLRDPVQQRQAQPFQYFLLGWLAIALLGMLRMLLASPPPAEPTPDAQFSVVLVLIAIQHSGVDRFLGKPDPAAGRLADQRADLAEKPGIKAATIVNAYAAVYAGVYARALSCIYRATALPKVWRAASPPLV
jgi:hypothetical protein